MAARVAAATRMKLIELSASFIGETVFSHPSKLELVDAARAADYTLVLHVLLVPEELAVERVRLRVSAGGHDVPENKIRERYRRLWALVAAAIVCFTPVYDSSGLKGPRIVAQLNDGFGIGSPNWPAWTPDVLRSACMP
jgi:predicted ABC-type ATPase